MTVPVPDDAAAPPANPLVTSFVRTLTPLIVGALLTLLARWQIPHADADTLDGLLDPIITAVYYAVARILEHSVDSRFGWLLGAAKTPVYVDPQANPVDPPASDPPLAPVFPDATVLGPAATITSLTPPTVVVNVYNGPSSGTIGDVAPPEPKATRRRRPT